MTGPEQVLGGLRLVVGAGTWLSPRLSGRVFGIPEAGASPGSALGLRLFGVRETLLAAGALSADPAVRRAALQAGVVVDAVDAVATVLALRAGAPRAAGPLVGVGALLFCGLGAWGLRSSQSFSSGA
jgi:hypothetical protein